MNIKNVVVVGAGMMGNALAQVFASNPDLHVVLKTRALKPDRWEPIENNLDIMISRGAAMSVLLVLTLLPALLVLFDRRIMRKGEKP